MIKFKILPIFGIFGNFEVRFSMLRQILLVLLNQKWPFLLFCLSNKNWLGNRIQIFCRFEKKFKIQKILEEQTNRISTKLNHLQIQLTDIHHLGCPKIRFFAKITKTYRFSMNWSSPIYPILSPTRHQRDFFNCFVSTALYSARKLPEFNFETIFFRALEFFWNANDNYSTSKIEIYLQTETQSVLIRLHMSHRYESRALHMIIFSMKSHDRHMFFDSPISWFHLNLCFFLS